MGLLSRLLRRRARPDAPDVLGTYDTLLADLERRGLEVRRAAATLVAVREELARTLSRHARAHGELSARAHAARVRGDAHAAGVLERDAGLEDLAAANARQALARTDADASLLLEAGGDLARELTELRGERARAAAQLAAGQAVSSAARATAERFRARVQLDAARDEVERAHHLAELYRQEGRERS